MSNLKGLAKDTAIYGLSSIVGRFLNYLLVPLYTAKLSAASGGYGVITNVYAYTALLLVILTYGMEMAGLGPLRLRSLHVDFCDCERVIESMVRPTNCP